MKPINRLHPAEKHLSFALKMLVSVAVLWAFSLPITRIAAAKATYTLEDGLMKLANGHYEIALSAEHGGIVYILDKSTSQNISEGSTDLWSAALDKGNPVNSSAYGGQFTSTWDEASATLTLAYSGAAEVQVTISVSDEAALKLQAAVTNNSGVTLSDFAFPGSLKVAAAEIEDALLPMMPGAQISSVFFEEGRTYVNEYPGVMFADYLAIRSGRGKIALYSQKVGALQPILIGYEPVKEDAGFTRMTHNYQTWIEDTKTWLSPWVVISIGQDYPQSISGYRADNSIDDFKSLTAKLGSAAQTYFESPLYKLDLVVLRQKFADLQDAVIHKLNFPGMIHFVAFQLAGHDHNYPDFIPPDPKWGTTENFAALIDVVHSQGSLAVPYTNFSWWDNDGPVILNLPADTPLNSVVNIKDTHGLPGFESFGPNNGFVMNLHNPFVQNKISEQHSALLDTVGVDAIFEDQWGARSAPYDFNPAGLDTYNPSTSYFEGILNHYRAHADSNLMTEIGVDVLADDAIAFMGTNYLWDMLGYRGATAGVTTYYPMAAMLFRDKVLLYQHDLAAETWTDNKDMLRWNLAQGYGLSIAFYDKATGSLNMDNPWLHLVGVFHKYALSNYADELVLSYDDLGNNVTRTEFSSYRVHSNWDSENAYEIAGHVLPPGGVITQANDGSVTAGVFTAYNNQELSDGEHYLVEVRGADAIQLFQPVGDDTDLRIQNMPAWETVTVTAHHYDGTAIGTVEASVDGDAVTFTCSNSLDGEAVGYYQIMAGEPKSS